MLKLAKNILDMAVSRLLWRAVLAICGMAGEIRLNGKAINSPEPKSGSNGTWAGTN